MPPKRSWYRSKETRQPGSRCVCATRCTHGHSGEHASSVFAPHTSDAPSPGEKNAVNVASANTSALSDADIAAAPPTRAPRGGEVALGRDELEC